MTGHDYPSKKAILSLHSSDWRGRLANIESKCLPDLSYLVQDDLLSSQRLQKFLTKIWQIKTNNILKKKKIDYDQMESSTALQDSLI